MKLPGGLETLLHKREEKRDLFFSLVLDPDGVIVRVWQPHPDGNIENIGFVSANAKKDLEEQIQAADQAIVKLEDIAKTRDIEKTVLGLPVTYLNAAGDILATLKPDIKKFTRELVLKPIGFVSIPAAIVHKLKKNEGVPPSVILIGISGTNLIVTLYKIGAISGQKIFTQSNNPVSDIENAFKEFTDAEVLPSRLLLYGVKDDKLETLRGELLKHPWTTRANFLHFPKIEIISHEMLINAVSLAGAAEMTQNLKEDETLETAPVNEEIPVENNIENFVDEPVKEKLTLSDEGVIVAEETQGTEKQFDPKSSPLDENVPNPDTNPIIEEPNIAMVSPEELGFRSNTDILEKPDFSINEKTQPIKTDTVKQVIKLPKVSFPKIVLPQLSQIRFPSLKMPGKSGVILSIIFIVLVMFGYLYYYLVPKATVTLIESTKNIDYSTSIIIDPKATTIDINSKILPGQKLEQSVTGEKTIQVNGKKKVGDPAKGSITIYNGNLSELTLAKGTILTANSLNFTLDSDVKIASGTASAKTPGSGNITAAVIGTEGNLSANTVFSVKGYMLDLVAAKNDQPLLGGTSREVTVVTRADQDNLVKLMTTDLVAKAKADLSSSVSGEFKLIENTLATVVLDKTFTQEIDQESPVLDGKVTIGVSGIVYGPETLKNMMIELISDQIPDNYSLIDSLTAVTLTSMTLKKDGTISVKVQFTGIAQPQLDLPKISQELAGQTVSRAEEYIKNIPGVVGVKVNFKNSFIESRLPINKKNIQIKIEIQK